MHHKTKAVLTTAARMSMAKASDSTELDIRACSSVTSSATVYVYVASVYAREVVRTIKETQSVSLYYKETYAVAAF